jgi:hypothetical protein
MVSFLFGCGAKRKDLRTGNRKQNMTPQGNRFYAIDMDRPVHIEDHLGQTRHRYLDETPSLWRDQQGRVLEQQPTATQEAK